MTAVFRGLVAAGLIFAALQASAQSKEEFTPPSLTDPVVDQAGMIDAATERKLNRALHKLWDEGGSQVAVLTVSSLKGLPIERASIQVAEDWKLGTKEKDNGVLLMVAHEDRKIRIEVGGGLEGKLTDVEAHRIIDQKITPLFKAGHFTDGILVGVSQIVNRTDPKADFGRMLGATAMASPRGATSKRRGSPFGFIIFALVMVASVLMRTLGPMLLGRRRGFGHGVMYGGGFGGGGLGGGGLGGFGGGGGGFSGGGASGGW